MLDIVDHPLNADGALDAGRVREIRLARPPVNALDTEALRQIAAAVGAGQGCAALMLTGQPGMFSAGLDVPSMLGLDRGGVAQLFDALWRAQRAIATSAVPVVFGLTGHCPAGGTVLAIHGDYRVMALGDYRLGLNEVQVGLFPGPLIHDAFRRLVGGHAAQLIARGALIDPATALRVGLVDELCEATQCTARALAVARDFAALPGEPMRLTRELARRDLVQLFGLVDQLDRLAREFGELGADLFCVPATQERLRKMFAKKR